MEIRLGYAGFDAGIAQVDQAAAELADVRRRTAAVVDGLLDGGWSGAAAESFATAWEEWLAGEAQLRVALASVADALAATRHDLTAGDHDTEVRLARLAERLGR